MKQIYIKILFLAAISYSLRAMESSESIVKNIMDNHISEVIATMFCRESSSGTKLQELKMYQPAWMQDYIIKVDESRLTGAQKINAVLKKKGNATFFVPEKIEYSISQEARNSVKRWVPEKLVLAKKIVRDEKKNNINKMQAEEIKWLIQETKYIDLHTGNLIPTSLGIAIVDTERRSFDLEHADPLSTLELGLRSLLHNKSLDEDAEKYVLQELESIKSKIVMKDI